MVHARMCTKKADKKSIIAGQKGWTSKAIMPSLRERGKEEEAMEQGVRKRPQRKIRPLLGNQVSRLRKGAEEGLKRLGFPPTDENIKLLRDIQGEVMGRILRGENSPEAIHDLILGEMKKRASRSEKSE